MTDAPQVQVRRVYDTPRDDDGQRVLVDRLWPRGLSKKRADALHDLTERAAHGRLTLLTAAKRGDISEATVLAGLLTGDQAPS